MLHLTNQRLTWIEKWPFMVRHPWALSLSYRPGLGAGGSDNQSRKYALYLVEQLVL